MNENIQIVDENDRPLRGAPRTEAWKNGWYYRVARVMLDDGDGSLLLQKRSHTKRTFADCWTSAASGGVDEGESYEAAAVREMQEEIGVSTPLTHLDTFPAVERSGTTTIKHFCAVFRGTLPRDTHFTVQAEEVSEVRWFKLDELKKEIAARPENFTPALRNVVERFYL